MLCVNFNKSCTLFINNLLFIYPLLWINKSLQMWILFLSTFYTTILWEMRKQHIFYWSIFFVTGLKSLWLFSLLSDKLSRLSSLTAAIGLNYLYSCSSNSALNTEGGWMCHFAHISEILWGCKSAYYSFWLSIDSSLFLLPLEGANDL